MNKFREFLIRKLGGYTSSPLYPYTDSVKISTSYKYPVKLRATERFFRESDLSEKLAFKEVTEKIVQEIVKENLISYKVFQNIEDYGYSTIEATLEVISPK